jgi:uncharacterized repeat protein (TIGR01451 family)
MKKSNSPFWLLCILGFLLSATQAHGKGGIKLIGNDTVHVYERNSGNKFTCYVENAYLTYSAKDTNGSDITNNTVITSNLDCSTPGVYYIKFNITLSGGRIDSATRTIIVNKCYGVPNNDFYAGAETSEIFYDIPLHSSADSGAYNFEWEFTSPSGFLSTSISEQPLLTIDELGKWLICFRAGNKIGWSSWKCKYVSGVPPFEYYLGPQKNAEFDSGILYDHGGPNTNYGNNRKTTVDYFRILPTGATEMEIRFKSLKLADNADIIRIYDGEDESGKLMTPVSGINASNQNTYRSKVLTATSGAVYITFETNSSGTDSGFAIFWKVRGEYKISGYAYYDRDSNCVFDPKKDTAIPTVKMKIGNNNVSAQFKDGYYSIITDSFAKEVYPILPKGWVAKCPAAGKDTWSLRTTGNINFGIRPDPSNPWLDLRVRIDNTRGFSTTRGINNTMFIMLDNMGNTRIDSGICKLKWSRKLKAIQPTLKNYIATDSTLEFKTSSMNGFDYLNTEINYTPFSTDTGEIGFVGTFFPLGSGKKDNDTSNNTFYLKLSIVNAHDPNDKQVSEPEAMNAGNKTLKYYVRFQNTGTAPATDVVVMDTLSNALDYNTVEFISSSHNCVLEQNGNILAFKFLNINLIDSNHNEKESHGYFHYSIKTKYNLKPYEKIKNTAHIYFDAEKPVTTNTTVNYWLSRPFVTANGGSPHTIEVCDTFYDPGAIAHDLLDGNLTQSIKRVSNYKNHIAGTYYVGYFAVNSHGDTGWDYRTLIIFDSIKPHIILKEKNIVDQMVVPVQILEPFADSVLAYDRCTGYISLQSKPGANGPVDANSMGNYPISYFATDAGNNKAWEDSFTIVYKVDDYIPPVFQNTTPDTLWHKINTPFAPDTIPVTDNYYSKSNITVDISHNVNSNATGIYELTYTATDSSGNSTTLEKKVYVSDQAHAKNIAPIHAPTVYPNPATHQLYIKNNNTSVQTIRIHLLDYTGRLIYETELPASAQERAIPLNNVPSGSYLVLIQQGTDIFKYNVAIIK